MLGRLAEEDLLDGLWKLLYQMLPGVLQQDWGLKVKDALTEPEIDPYVALKAQASNRARSQAGPPSECPYSFFAFFIFLELAKTFRTGPGAKEEEEEILHHQPPLAISDRLLSRVFIQLEIKGAALGSSMKVLTDRWFWSVKRSGWSCRRGQELK